jgi:MYXO-CTERM domain-containing protein
MNNFQGRYIIRHKWTGAVACSAPRRGIWGGPPAGSQIAAGPQAATNVAFAPRGKIQLPSLVAQDVPEINVKQDEPLPGGAGFKNRPQGCGCAASDVGSAAGGSVLALLTIVALRRRRTQEK